MAKLLIPTRNRPTGLGGVLQFLAKHYPKTMVIVADGSADDIKPRNQAAIAAAPGLNVEYRPYPYELPFFDRLLDALHAQTDPFIIMGSDDDFPMMDTMERGEVFLRANPDFVTAMGATVHLTLRAPGDLVARLATVRQIASDTVEARSRAYAMWAFSTTYAVARREHLIARYERAASRFIPGFYDFATGLHDVMAGKIRALPEIGFFGTRNYSHSYLRPEEPLLFLRRSAEVLTLLNGFRQDLIDFGGMAPEAAKSTAEMMLQRRIAELCGVPAHRRAGFMESPMFQNAIVQKQISLFAEVFAEGTPGRQRYLDRFADLVAALQSNAHSTDNAGEKRFYETLEAQSANEGGTDAAPAGRAPVRATRPRPAEGAEGSAELVQLRAVDTISLLEILPEDEDSGANNAPAPSGPPITPLPAGLLAPHLLVIGQSNVANHGKPRAASDFGHCTFDGMLLPLADPIAGASGNLGSVWTRFAPLARDRLGWDDLTITNLAQGGTTIADWSEPGRTCHDNLVASLPVLKAMARPVTHVIFHQGEADQRDGTTGPDYREGLRRLHALVRESLPTADWIICRASCRQGALSAELTAVQTELAQTLPGAHPGPDTDLFGWSDRYDDTHLKASGLEAFALALCDSFAELGLRKPG